MTLQGCLVTKNNSCHKDYIPIMTMIQHYFNYKQSTTKSTYNSDFRKMLLWLLGIISIEYCKMINKKEFVFLLSDY
jgi:hypothetical protein